MRLIQPVPDTGNGTTAAVIMFFSYSSNGGSVTLAFLA